MCLDSILCHRSSNQRQTNDPSRELAARLTDVLLLHYPDHVVTRRRRHLVPDIWLSNFPDCQPDCARQHGGVFLIHTRLFPSVLWKRAECVARRDSAAVIQVILFPGSPLPPF
jgi:hypothetical protein